MADGWLVEADVDADMVKENRNWWEEETTEEETTEEGTVNV